MSATFPRQDVSESEKNKNDKQFFKDAVDYAARKWLARKNPRLQRLNRQYNNYNGTGNEGENTYLNYTYGKENKIKFIDYRPARAKVDLIIGEQLNMPLNGTVYVLNSDAMVEKLEEASAVIGMHHVPEQVEKLRGMVGVDVFGGMPMPQVPQGKTIFDTLSPKLKSEMLMQTIVNQQITDMNLKQKLNENMTDLPLVSECHGKVYIDVDGNVKYETISPQTAMAEESDRDPFGERSPYRGRARKMFIHEIIRELRPKKDMIDRLQEKASKSEDLFDSGYADCYEMIDNSLAFWVFEVEWTGFERNYLKVYTDKTGEQREVEMSSEYYEKNKKRIDREVKAGKYEIKTGYKSVLYEATRIGHDEYLNMGKVRHMPASWTNPSWTMSRYVHLFFNTQNGVRISIKQLTEHLDRTYSLIMWQINRELAKAKGKAIVYDLAKLPKNKSIREQAYQMLNDGIVTYDSSADGNMSGQDAARAAGFSEVDLGISATVATLIPLKVEIEQTIDRVTGILQNRMGDIPASATAYSAQQSIQASRTTTAPMFFYFNQYVERVMRLVLEMSKISYGILKPEKGEMVLGVEMARYMRVTSDIAFNDYGYAMGDISKEMRIRDIIRGYTPSVLNAMPELVGDMLEAEMADTVAEAVGIVRKATREWREREQQNAEAQRQHEQSLVDQQAAGQVGAQQVAVQGNIAREAVKQYGDVAKNTQKAADQVVVERVKGPKGPAKN